SQSKGSDSILICYTCGNDIPILVLNPESGVWKRFSIRNVCLGQFQFSGNRLIDKANARLIFHVYNLSVLADLKVISVLIQLEAFRGSLFFHKISSVKQTIRLVNAF